MPDRPPAGPTPERRAELLAEYTRLSTEGQRINQAKSTLLKNFESEGGDGAALKSLHKSMKLDPAEASAKLHRLLQYHHGAGIKVTWGPNGQGSVLDELTTGAVAPEKNTQGARDLAAARAHADGYNSGKAGAVPKDNPFSHAPGSEEYVEWHNGRDEGQQDRLGKNPAQAARIAEAETADTRMPGDGAAAADVAARNIPF